MPKIKGTSSLAARAPTNAGSVYFPSMKRVATPDTRNNSDSRQGLSSSITGSSQVSLCALLIRNPQDT
jgi:hypothetical protein